MADIVLPKEAVEAYHGTSGDKEISLPKEAIDAYHGPDIKATQAPGYSPEAMAQNAESFIGGASTLGSEHVGKVEGGLMQSLLSKVMPHITGQPSPYDVDADLQKQGFKGDLQSSAYDAGKDIQTQKYKDLKAQAPWMFTAGKIGGSLPLFHGLSAATGAVAGAIPGMEAASGIAKAGQSALESLPGFAGKLAGSAGRVATSAVEAAPVGAEFGALDSEKNGSEYLKDIGHSAALGSLVVGGVKIATDMAPIVGNYIKGKIGDAIPETATGREMSEAYKLGKQGYMPSGAQESAQRGELQNTIQDTASQLDQGQKALNDKILNVVDSASQNGAKLAPDANLINQASQLEGFIKSPEQLNAISKLKSGQLSPTEAYNLRKFIKNNYVSDFTLPKNVRNEFNNFSDSLKSGTENAAPGFSEALQDFHDFATVSQTLTGKGAPVNTQGLYENPMGVNDLSSTVKDFSDQGIWGDKGNMDAYRQASDRIAALKNSNPDVFTNAGVDPDAVMKQISGLSDKGQAIKGIGQMSFMPSDIVSTATSLGTTKPAYLAGTVARQVGKITNLFAASPQELQGVAQKLQASPNFQAHGQQLQQALATNNQPKVNALTFTLMQNPTARSYLGLDNDVNK